MTDLLLSTASAAGATATIDLRDLASVITAGVALVALIISPITTWLTLRAARRNTECAAWQKANELELETIRERLDGFYGPFRTMSDVNRLMFRVLRSRSNHDLVLMRDLLDPNFRSGLPAGEAVLLAEVAANAKKLREFIENNIGMVDAKVMPYLSRAGAHYRMLELAYDGVLGTDPTAFKDFVFPATIDTVLQLEVERLERRRALLMSKPFEAPPPVEELQIPDNKKLAPWTNPPRTSTADLTAPLDPSSAAAGYASTDSRESPFKSNH